MKALGVLASSKFRGQEVAEDLPGKTYLEENAKLFYDFSLLTGSGAISNGNAGLEDQGPNGNDAVIVGTPQIRNITINSISVPTVEAVGTNAVSINSTGAGIFDESFEIFYYSQIEDGIPTVTLPFWGATSASFTSIVDAVISNTGKLLVRYRTPTADSRWDSTSAIMTDGVNGEHLLRIKYDFDTDTFGAWLDGDAIPGSFISGNMAALNPTTWAQDHNIYFGSKHNQAGGTDNVSATNSLIRIAVTDILTEQQAADVSEYLTSFGTSTPAITPTIQATNLIATPFQTSMQLSWTGGNGTNKIVIGRQGSAVNALPTNGVNYTANAAFGSGSEIGSGNFVVFAGTTNTVTVTGLTRDTLYYFDVYEFNLSGFSYLTTLDSNTLEEGQRTDYINDQDFADYATDYTENQVVGFSSDVVDGELVLSGNPKGYQDWVQHDEWIESLEEFELEILVTLGDELTADTAGIGLGIKNDLSSEANRAVFGYFNTVVGSDQFGSISIYSGTGSVSPTAFTWRGTSSSTLTPTQGNVYKIQFSRVISGNDAAYVATVTDMSTEDNPSITIGWLESGRPSSAFYDGSTNAYIYQNGGTHNIDYFRAYRLGDQGGEVEPPPGPEDYDVYVTITGNDTSGDGTIGNPYRTNNRGLLAIQALGGAVGSKSMYTGPGIYPENSQLSPPLNLGLWEGAGVSSTEIRGAASLNSRTDRSSMTGFLVNLQSGSHTSHPLTIKNIKFNGNKPTWDSPASMKGCFAIQRRNGVILTDIEITGFNTCAVRVWNTNELTLQNFYIHNSSGMSGTSFSYYHIELTNTGGSSVLDGTYNVTIKDGTIMTNVLGEGQGIGFIGGPPLPLRSNFNMEIDNVNFLITPETIDDQGHQFALEWNDHDTGNIWVHDCYMTTNISLGGIGKAYVSGPLRLSHNHIDMPSTGNRPPSLIVESQISNFEFDHNYVVHARNGGLASSNNPEGWHTSSPAEFRTTHGNWHIHHNIISTRGSGWSFGTGLVGGLNWPVQDVLVEHNTFIFETTSGQPVYGLVIDDGPSPGTNGNYIVRNNAFHGQPPANSILIDQGGAVTGTNVAQYNKSNFLTMNSSRSGFTINNNQVHSGSNGLGLSLTGGKPTSWEQAFSGNYYRPTASSVLKNAGHDGSTIGALVAL